MKFLTRCTVLTFLGCLAISCKKEKDSPQYYGEPIEVTRRFFSMRELSAYNPEPSISPNGRYLVYEQSPITDLTTMGLNVVDLQNGDQWVLNSKGFSPSWSPDSKRLCYVIGQNIVISDVKGQNLQYLTSGGGCVFPLWHPRGDTISYTNTTKGNYFINLSNREIKQVQVDGMGGGEVGARMEIFY